MPWNTWSREMGNASFDMHDLHNPWGPLERFEERWGEFSLQTIRHVLEQPRGSSEEDGKDWEEEEHRLLAIFALGRLVPSEMEVILTPLLDSKHRRERWAATIALGRHHNERVFSLLLDLLLEGIFEYPHEAAAREAVYRAIEEARERGMAREWESLVESATLEAYEQDCARERRYEWFLSQRLSVAEILGEWGNARAVPALRRALATCWQIEREPGPFAGLWDGYRNDWWHAYEDRLAYTLGQLEAWGALTGFNISVQHLQIAIVSLVLGSLGAPFSLSEIEDPETVKRLLAERFGFSREVQDRYLARLSMVYEVRAHEEQWLKREHRR